LLRIGFPKNFLNLLATAKIPEHFLIVAYLRFQLFAGCIRFKHEYQSAHDGLLRLGPARCAPLEDVLVRVVVAVFQTRDLLTPCFL
jgi:hypothetical protein